MWAKRHLHRSTREGTYIHTYRQTDIAAMTESAQWADSVKIMKGHWSQNLQFWLRNGLKLPRGKSLFLGLRKLSCCA